MKLTGVKDAEAWSSDVILGPGWHTVEVESAEESTTSNGNPQIELRFASGDGAIRDWLVVVEQTAGKVAQLLDAVKLDRSSINEDSFNPSVLEGRKLAIFVAEEPDNRNPGQTRSRVKTYATIESAGSSEPAPTGNGSAQDDGDLPF